MLIGHGDTTSHLSEADVRRIVADGFATAPGRWQAPPRAHPRRHADDADGAHVDALTATLGPRAAALDFLVALGTHQPMSDEHLGRLIGRPVVDGRAGGSRIFNHRWDIEAPSPPLARFPRRRSSSCPAGS